MIRVDGTDVRVIATEEHYIVPEFVEATGRLLATHAGDLDVDDLGFFLHTEAGRPWRDRLADLDAGRLGAMDDAGVDVQVLSLMAPGVQIFDTATAVGLAELVNDRLAETVARAPTRYAGLAVFAPQAPSRAAKEIERAMGRLALHGLVVNSHTHGEYLDDPKYWSIFEAAEALDAALYIHPRQPPSAYRALVENVAGEKTLAGGLWGFQMETSLHAMRLIVSGVFDRFPKLKIVLGHMGEGLPFWLYRLDYMYERGYRRHGKGRARRLPSEYFNENFFVTISGMHDHRLCVPVLRSCHAILGADRMLFAADHPFQSASEATAILRDSNLPRANLETIAWRNAARIFRVPG